MILLAALLVAQCCVSGGAAAGGSVAGLERIEGCGSSCSQGLRCKTKPQMLFPPPCQNPPGGLGTSSVFRNVSAATVMKCEGRQKCSLHLRISAALQLAATIHGVSICAATTGMMAICRTVSFAKASREKMSGLQVDVTSDCFHVFPGQHFEIKVRTVPSYCGVAWSGTHVAPGCNTEDLKQHVPDCITGRLSYVVNNQAKEVAVSVSDMLEDHDYHLRLCRKNFICVGTGAKTLISKEEPVKTALLRYSRPLPCLCIEGWSAVMDASRVQVCPFQDHLEELWTDISFQPLEGRLWWEPACPVAATVALCQRTGEDVCVDLLNSSQNVSKAKITFSEVDPHPQLCMKFTVGSRSWIRCPFLDARFQEWELREHGPGDVRLLAQVNAKFSVGVCAKGDRSAWCRTVETHTVQTVKQKAVAINLPGELCNSCLQVKRLDAQFAVTDLYCTDECDQTASVSHRASLNLTWVFVLVAALLCVALLTLVCHLYVNVDHRRKRNLSKDDAHQQQADSAFECVIPVLHGKPVPPQSEKVNLISD